MAAYVNKHLQKYISEKDLKESICNANPVPGNLNKPDPLDDYLKELLEEKHKFKELTLDKTLQKLQQKTINVMGTLAKVWMALENADKSKKSKVEISLKDLTQNL